MELTIQIGGSNEAQFLNCQVFSRSDTGDRPENQDFVAHRVVGDWLICVLADGAGGHRGGEVASQHAVEGMLNAFETKPTLDPTSLLGMAHAVNQSILGLQATHNELADMHTTLCVLVLNQRTRQAVRLHVGDSRIYHFRHEVLLSRTRDHSVMQWMIDHHQPERQTTRNALYTAMGEPADQLLVDIEVPCAVAVGDWFLLCSDGLWEHFNDGELALLGCNLPPSDGCNTHIHQLAFSRAAGRSDNLSSILVFVGDRVPYNG